MVYLPTFTPSTNEPKKVGKLSRPLAEGLSIWRFNQPPKKWPRSKGFANLSPWFKVTKTGGFFTMMSQPLKVMILNPYRRWKKKPGGAAAPPVCRCHWEVDRWGIAWIPGWPEVGNDGKSWTNFNMAGGCVCVCVCCTTWSVLWGRGRFCYSYLTVFVFKKSFKDVNQEISVSIVSHWIHLVDFYGKCG